MTASSCASGETWFEADLAVDCGPADTLRLESVGLDVPVVALYTGLGLAV